MVTDLRCSRYESSRINYYGTSTTMEGSYKGTDAKYVCEDCKYVRVLILDVSGDINEERQKEVKKELEKIRKGMDEEYKKVR